MSWDRVWKRRYGQWDEVRPGKNPSLPFTETMAFAHFLTWRACEHARKRYATIKDLDPDHPVTVHGGAPSAAYCGSEGCFALNRGNDWFFADHVDGIGTSSFPKWEGIDDLDFDGRIEFVQSAARGKKIWLSELQGGRAATGFDAHEPVDALSQQHWIWDGIACGADTILFWCWRDEVFCREAGGFGMAGNDGLATERLQAMTETTRILTEHEALLTDYQPQSAEAGILFSPSTYYHHWASEGTARRAYDALRGYARALTRYSLPYVVVEEEHLHALGHLKILFLPRTTVTGPALEEALEAFVRKGGTLVCESECGAFSPEGLYRYGPDRFIARLTGINEIGRRKLTHDTIAARIEDRTLALSVNQWLTPLSGDGGETLADCSEGALITRVPIGSGYVVPCGVYLGEPYYQHAVDEDRSKNDHASDLEHLLRYLVACSCGAPEVEVIAPETEHNGFPRVKWGTSLGRRVVFVFFQEEHTHAHLRFHDRFFQSEYITDIISGTGHCLNTNECLGPELIIPCPECRFAVLTDRPRKESE